MSACVFIKELVACFHIVSDFMSGLWSKRDFFLPATAAQRVSYLLVHAVNMSVIQSVQTFQKPDLIRF